MPADCGREGSSDGHTMTPSTFEDEAARQRALMRRIAGLDSTGDNATRRGVEVYRANAAALAERALGAMYPTLRALLGEQDFRQLAREHWREDPPLRGDMGVWGLGLPDWIERHAGLIAWPYLADCARLDVLRHECERAADVELDVASMMLLDQGDPAGLVLRLHPGVGWLASAWPIASIFEAHQNGCDASLFAAREAIAQRVGEAVLVARQGWQARVHRIDAGACRWLAQLLAGESITSALDAAGPGFDFAAWLGDALRNAWLQGVAVRADQSPPVAKRQAPGDAAPGEATGERGRDR